MSWIAVASPLLLLVGWEIASATGLLRAVFFPRPTTVAEHFLRLVVDGSLPHHGGVTVMRVAWTVLLATPPAVAVGLAMGISRRTREGLDPLFAVIYPIPSVLFLPLISFLLRSAEAALVVTGAITPFFLVAYTTMTGVQQLDRTVLEAATHYGARGWRLFLKVLLPGTLPFIFTGLRLGLGYALIVLIAVEMVSARDGLGALLWLSWGILKVEEMYAALVAIALLGAFLTWGLGLLRARLLPWVEDVAGTAR
ncbi:MAG: ABC transporter permease [Candidatus Rokubacteria bacterium]|nr:ABC transporter permease [Candidatus Rokubacteria bacterium]